MPGKPPLAFRAISAYIKKHPGCTSGEIIEGTGLSTASVRQTLWDAVHDGRLLRTGARRYYQHWVPTAPVRPIPVRRPVTRVPQQPEPMLVRMSPQRQLVLDYVAAHPDCLSSQIRATMPDVLGLCNVLRTLVAGGYLVRTGTHHYFTYRLAGVANA